MASVRVSRAHRVYNARRGHRDTRLRFSCVPRTSERAIGRLIDQSIRAQLFAREIINAREESFRPRRSPLTPSPRGRPPRETAPVTAPGFAIWFAMSNFKAGLPGGESPGSRGVFLPPGHDGSSLSPLPSPSPSRR